MKPRWAILCCMLLTACERSAPVFVPSDTLEERGPFPVGFVGTLSGADAAIGTHALQVLQRELDGASAKGREIELHVLDDAGNAAACAQGIQRFASELQAPLVLVASSQPPAVESAGTAVLVLSASTDVSLAAAKVRTALDTTAKWTVKDLQAALVR